MMTFLLGINSKFKNEFYYNGGLVDVDISIERVMNFLSENKVELEKLAIEHNKIIKDHRVEWKYGKRNFDWKKN